MRIKSAKDVQRFAAKYGPLALCEHGLHWRHSLDEGTCSVMFAPDVTLGSTKAPVCRESVDAFLRYVAEARAIVSIALELRFPRIGKGEDWQVLRLAEPDSIDAARDLIANTVNQWLLLGDVRPVVLWDEPEPRLALQLGGLWWTALGFDGAERVFTLDGGTFAAIATQLFSAVKGSGNIAFCSGCNDLFTSSDPKPHAGRRTPKPRQDRRNYCSECRASGVPELQRQREHRAKRGREGGRTK
jgi:hypothetical protein